MLYKDFQPSVPSPTLEEKQYAYDRWREAYEQGEETPAEATEIWERRSQVAEELCRFMRSDTKEIVAKMLPGDMPLTLEKMMDILHVYYWWNLDKLEPVDCFEELLEDLTDERFVEAVEIMHREFPEYCPRRLYGTGSDGRHCESQSGIDCLRWDVALTRTSEETEALLASPYARADKLNMMFYEALYGDDDDYGETPYDLDDAEEDLERSPVTLNREPDTHTLQLMLGQHAIRRLSDAGADDIEALDATAVIELEKTLRDQDYHRMIEYTRYRKAGGEFKGFLRELTRGFLNDKKFMKMLVDDFGAPGVKLKQLSLAERDTLTKRYIAENYDEFERLEAFYLLKEEGSSPSYRRRMAEDHFPRNQRT